MKKKVFIKTVEEKLIGEILLPRSLFLKRENGQIKIMGYNNYPKEDMKVIESSIEAILDKAETLNGLHFKHKISRFPKCHFCGFYIEEESEKEIHFITDGVKILQNLF